LQKYKKDYFRFSANETPLAQIKDKKMKRSWELREQYCDGKLDHHIRMEGSVLADFVYGGITIDNKN